MSSHATRVGQRGIDVGRAGSSIGTSGLSENALGQVGASSASAHQRLTQQAQRSLQRAGGGMQGQSSLLHRTTQNISETETEQANRFRGIGAEEPAVSAHSRPASTTPGSQPGSPRPETSSHPPVSQWENHSLPAGTTVYHSTSTEHGYNIANGGIRPVTNAWGGGELGQGFYTHTDLNSAQNYVQKADYDKVTLEYQTKNELTGKQKPEGTPWLGESDPNEYKSQGAFINKTSDPNEIKFHDGANQLQLQGIHWNGNRYGSYGEYDQAVEDEYGFKPSEMYGPQS